MSDNDATGPAQYRHLLLPLVFGVGADGGIVVRLMESPAVAGCGQTYHDAILDLHSRLLDALNTASKIAASDARTERPPLTVEEVAERLRINPATVRAWLKDGRLHGVHMGSDKVGWRIPAAEVEAFLERMRSH